MPSSRDAEGLALFTYLRAALSRHLEISHGQSQAANQFRMASATGHGGIVKKLEKDEHAKSWLVGIKYGSRHRDDLSRIEHLLLIDER